MLRRLFPVAFLLGSLSAQDVRELSVPVGHVNLVGATTAAINTQIAAGYRLVDLDYRGANLYEAVFVQNTGSYSAGWWWYTGQTAAQVSANLTANSARLIDLEPYDDGAGNLRFACIMVDNTGANAKAWWWYYNTTTAALGTALTTNNARLVNLDTYTLGATTYYSGVMIRNTGVDARGWWWYLNVTTAQVSSALSTNGARLYDLERRSNGNWDCVMIDDPANTAWYWFVDITSSQIGYLIGQYGVRPIDIESYLVGGLRRYAMVTINNSNALTTSVGNAMRSVTDGQVGLWLQRMNGSNMANLNGDTQFEPASTMKTLHHVHAMRRVYLGTVALTTPLTVYANYQSAGSSCPIDTGPFSEPLQAVLNEMMGASDNARTQAIRAYFGESNINSTAAALGMTNTGLHHRIGCGNDAVANPNDITLRDLNTLHEQVVNGYLGSFRQLFYDIMRNDFAEIDTVISAEGASLGLSAATVASFRSLTSLAHKKGGYGLSDGVTTWYDRTEFGWISLPFISNDVVVPREYGFGVFANRASTDAQAVAAVYQQGVPELLRSTIRSALLSWNNSLASVQSFGAGCGSPVAYNQTVVGLPRIGTTVSYRGNSGFASSLAVLGVGFSSTVANGNPLPLALAPFGSDPGCFATNDILINQTTIAGATGLASFNVSLPNNTDFLGVAYLTQCYTFGPTSFRTSNSYRSIVGL